MKAITVVSETKLSNDSESQQQINKKTNHLFTSMKRMRCLLFRFLFFLLSNANSPKTTNFSQRPTLTHLCAFYIYISGTRYFCSHRFAVPISSWCRLSIDYDCITQLWLVIQFLSANAIYNEKAHFLSSQFSSFHFQFMKVYSQPSVHKRVYF